MKSCWHANAKGGLVACDFARQFDPFHTARLVRNMGDASLQTPISDENRLDVQRRGKRQRAGTCSQLRDAAARAYQASSTIDAGAVAGVARAPRILPALCKKQRRCLQVRLRRFDLILTRLQKLLQKLSREQRQSILLRDFSQSQRLALERWMLRRKAVESSSSSDGLAALRPLKRHRSKAALACGSAQARRTSVQGACCHKHAQREIGDTVATNQDSNSSGIVRVVRDRGRYQYYTAFCAVGSLELFSKTCRELTTARQCQSILSTIRYHTMAYDGLFEERFRRAVLVTLQEFGSEICTLGLKFCVRLRVLWIPTPLRTAAYKIFSDVEREEGLSVRQRLENARGHVVPHRWNICRQFTSHELTHKWEHLQHEYFKAMVDAGRKPENILKKLEALTRNRESRQLNHEKHWGKLRWTMEHRQVNETCGKHLDTATVSLAHKKIENAIHYWLVHWAENEEKLLRSCGYQRLPETRPIFYT